ncbi:hypothetical protein VNI00_010556 [Paramarasmius palmivorus]|uniref:Uncharacterized protein n=1 Tax=Paramarasmius palmivorus TaxID=297713 RepID=A0AAW0CGS2_9AGAR
MDIVPSEHVQSGGFLEAVSGVTDATWTASDTTLLDNLSDAENHALDAVVATVVKKNYLSRFVETHYQIAVDNPQASKAVPTLSLIHAGTASLVASGLATDNVKRLVLHVTDNKYASYASKDMARKAFVVSVATREARVIASAETAVAYDPVPQVDGYLYP